ncbi:MAG: hypothetical protein WBM44_15100 [Waterburya sp.]
MATWSNCSVDGRLCYVCSNDAGICICNWFYNGVWQPTTDCGSGFNSAINLYEAGTFKPDERVELEGTAIPKPSQTDN